MTPTGNPILDALPVVLVDLKGEQVEARKTGAHRGYEIYLMEGNNYRVYKNGRSCHWSPFSSAWSCVCWIDEECSP